METLTADGRLEDLSGNGDLGTIVGTVDVDGEIGRARHFDGAGDKVQTSAPVAGLTHWTIALWVKWSDGTNVYEHPIGLGKGHDATFWFSGSILAFKTSDASGNTVLDAGLSSTMSTGVWYHLGATFNGTNVTGYLDGVEVFSALAPATTIRSNSVKIGTSGSESRNFFKGTIDEVRLYNRALNASEVASLTLLPSISDGSILSYDMENLTVDGLMKDLSGNLNDGNLSGTVAATGRIGWGRGFNGLDDRVSAFVPVAGLKEWTINAASRAWKRSASITADAARWSSW